MAIWIKICGTTSVEDAETVAAAGASAVGFVFARSPRRIAALDARTIATRLPATLQRVGVFVNEKPERVRDIVTRAGLTAVQFHGDETPEYVQSLFSAAPPPSDMGYPAERRRATRIFKAIPMDGEAGAKIAKFLAAGDAVDAFVLDTAGELRGGSGKKFPWDAATGLMKQFPRVRFVIAGGLNPENVGEAVTKLRPWGVDVASGVEKQPGVKIQERVFAFVDAVRAAEKALKV
jgi:phosphoribosylanthranilate isomerase